MNWLNKLERKYGKYGIPNLMQYLIGGMVLVFLMDTMIGNMIEVLGFSGRLILQGQVWRLVTFVFVPQRSGFFVIFYFLILFFFSRILESSWGTFKFNLYLLIGSIGTILASLTLELLTGLPVPLTNFNLYFTLLFAVAAVAPDYEIRVYFILPVKLKYLGYIYGAYVAYQFFFGGFAMMIITAFTMMNFLLFFGPGLFNKSKQAARKQQFRQANKPRPKTRTNKMPKEGQVIQVAFHCCEACGKTEKDDPNLEFRYCSKCEGHHEYCTEHILNHEHKTEA